MLTTLSVYEQVLPLKHRIKRTCPINSQNKEKEDENSNESNIDDL